MIDEWSEHGVAWLTFDRPGQLNAFTADGYGELSDALERHGADDGTRVVVLTGAGRAFSVGADRSLLDPKSTGSGRQRAGDNFARLLDALAAFPKPLFAAVNGLAVGFGATVLLYCDVVILADTARLKMPFTELGIVPEAGSSALLLTQVGRSNAMWTVLSSDWIEAANALEMGWASRLVSAAELVNETSAAAAKIAALSPRSVEATKRLMTAGRAALARQAIDREMSEMSALFGRQ